MMSILEFYQKFKKREISPVEVTKEYLRKIEKKDKDIGAFITLSKKLAIKQAEIAEKRFKEEENPPLLCGIPCAIKDNILVEGIKCTAGSLILENYIASFDATAIKKLKKEGAVILGKTNMDEFAMGSSTENSAFFPTKNPLSKDRVPGGSSGGSAAAVAADFCQFALGSDTGGSIRQPASFCGIVGFKPTYGRVSRFGLIAMASSLDQIGPLTKTVEDAEIVFKVIEGKDENDSTTIKASFSPFSPVSLSKLKIGLPKEYFVEGIQKEVKESIEEAIKKLEKNGAHFENISLPHTKYALPVYYLIMSSEVSSNLARYDGICYGRSILEEKGEEFKKDFFEVISSTRAKFLGREVKRRILLGTFALSAGYFDKYYLLALKIRNLIKQDFDKAFKKVDIILTPTSPTLPFKLGERISDPIKMYLADIYTVSANLAGLPALSLPCKKIKKLPVGLQIIGNFLEDEKVLSVAKEIEKILKET